MAKMSRIVSTAALLVVVAAGCGGAARPDRSAFHGVPPALAQDWEGQASAIAAAASAGDSCWALHLATSLRDDIVNSEHKLPFRLRSPLVTGVKALADRITCTPVAPPEKPKPPGEPKEKPPTKPHDKGHHKGHDG